MQPILQQDIIDKYTVFEKKISISLAFSAAFLLLLMTTSPLLFNVVPVQAQTPMTIRTSIPADGGTFEGYTATVTFDIQGTVLNPRRMDITNGSLQITSGQDGKILHNGSISSIVSCCLTNLSGGEKFSLDTPTADDTIVMTTRCSTLATNGIDVFYLSGP